MHYFQSKGRRTVVSFSNLMQARFSCQPLQSHEDFFEFTLVANIFFATIEDSLSESNIFSQSIDCSLLSVFIA